MVWEEDHLDQKYPEVFPPLGDKFWSSWQALLPLLLWAKCCCRYLVCIYMSAMYGACRLRPVVLAWVTNGDPFMMISCGYVVVAGEQ
jgi:hypothetical protein